MDKRPRARILAPSHLILGSRQRRWRAHRRIPKRARGSHARQGLGRDRLARRRRRLHPSPWSRHGRWRRASGSEQRVDIMLSRGSQGFHRLGRGWLDKTVEGLLHSGTLSQARHTTDASTAPEERSSITVIEGVRHVLGAVMGRGRLWGGDGRGRVERGIFVALQAQRLATVAIGASRELSKRRSPSIKVAYPRVRIAMGLCRGCDRAWAVGKRLQCLRIGPWPCSVGGPLRRRDEQEATIEALCKNRKGPEYRPDNPQRSLAGSLG